MNIPLFQRPVYGDFGYNPGFGKKITFRKPPFSEIQLNDMLEQARIDLDVEIAIPEGVLVLNQYGNVFTLCTAGNFSLITGKAKSRKSYLAHLFLASVLNSKGSAGMMNGSLVPDKRKAILFDTEQGNAHVLKAGRRIVQMAGPESADLLKTYSLRSNSPNERLIMIEHAIYNTPGLGFVVIDGLRDLITSINDEDQASELVNKLLKWTKDLNIHIVGVLHQNKNDNNPRGHLGTEAVNKAETVISVTKAKNKQLSTVSATQCRDLEFAPFEFVIDEEGLPTIVEKSEKQPSALAIPSKKELSSSAFKEILQLVFKEIPQPRFGKLVPSIKNHAKSLGYSLSDNKVKNLITEGLTSKVLGKEGAERSKSAYYTLNLL